jgi:hypothetical protein
MMDPLYATWPMSSPLPPQHRPAPRMVDPMDAFSFGQPARGLHAWQQEWAPALDLFDIDRPDGAPPAPLTFAKLLGLVALLTVFAGILLGAVGRLVMGAFSSALGS